MMDRAHAETVLGRLYPQLVRRGLTTFLSLAAYVSGWRRMTSYSEEGTDYPELPISLHKEAIRVILEPLQRVTTLH
jgi:hypothetical protein